MKHTMAICGLLAWPGALAMAQETPAPVPAAGGSGALASGYVTRDEYNKLQSKLDAAVLEMQQSKKDQTLTNADVDKTIEEMQADLAKNHRLVDDLHLGTTKFLVTGDGAVGFTSQRKSDSTFSAGFAPLFLFELDKKLLFEGALDIAGGTSPDDQSSTSVDLKLANLTYLVNDNLFIGGGLFAVPFGRYHTHFDPSWIDKLPDDPLVFGDRAIAPGSETGFFAGGSVPVSTTKVEYNAYVTNGPNLNVSSPDQAGSLNFDDYTDLNNGKAVGGRLGFLPTPEFDFGYSVQYSNPTPRGFDHDIHALLQGVDATYKAQVEALQGTLETRVEWVWSKVDKATYDVGAGPFTFNNNRNGGYVLLAYRPTMVDNKVLKNLEFVFRYDKISVSQDAPGGGDESRYTFGVDYWLTPAVVLKVAYQVDEKQVGPDQNVFFVQCGFGL